MPLQVAMKRTVQVLFALTPIVAIALASYGLKQVAGSVLLGGGGLTFALMCAMALTRKATAPTTTLAPVAVAATAPAVSAAPPAAELAPAPPEPKPQVEAKVEARAEPKVAPKAEVKAAPQVEPKAEPKLAAKGKGKRARKRAKAAAAAAAAAAPAPVAPAKPKAVIVETAPEARSPEIEEVAAFFVQAVEKDTKVKQKEPAPVDDFAADELAFFAEGENQAMRASDSSPHWHLGMG